MGRPGRHRARRTRSARRRARRCTPFLPSLLATCTLQCITHTLLPNSVTDRRNKKKKKKKKKEHVLNGELPSLSFGSYVS
eukprot:4878648-Prymnesium_polylepis.1